MNLRLTEIGDAMDISLGVGGEPDLTRLIGRVVNSARSSLFVTGRPGRYCDAHEVVDVNVIKGTCVRRNDDVEHAQLLARMDDPMQRFVLHGYRGSGSGPYELECED
jgi:hypothetical protein